MRREYIYNQIKSKLQDLQIYEPGIAILDSYDESKVPFITLNLGKEIRNKAENSDSYIQVYDCQLEFELIYVNRLGKQKENDLKQIKETSRVCDNIELVLSNVKHVTYQNGNPVNDVKYSTTFLKGLEIENISVTYPENGNNEIAIFFDGKINLQLINN